MKLQTRKVRTGFTLVELLVVIAIIVALASMATPAIFKALRRAAMAENVSNIKQIKLTMDSFAMDNDSVYPSEDTADFYEIQGSETSNDLLRQLFASGNTNSERIFWVKGSKVCNKAKPDDTTTVGGKFNQQETLQAGDCGFAYVEEQSQTDNPSRPLLFDSPPTAQGLEFDPDLWDQKAVVLRIDGSAKPERLNPNNKLMDGDNKELLTTASEVWGSATTNIQIAYPRKKQGS
jgi:prepilin-type N-terminal cleavage/methylation domain-containing protein